MMISSNSALVTLRPDLGGAMEEWQADARRHNYIALRVLPVVPVEKAISTYPSMPREELLNLRDVKRHGSRYNRAEWRFDMLPYATEEYGIEYPVDMRQQSIYRDLFDIESVSARLAQGDVVRAAEYRVSQLVFNATTWNGASLTTGVTNEWDDLANATPIVDINAARLIIFNETGLWANKLAINRKVFNNLRNCDEIIERINSTGAGDRTLPTDITAEKLAQVFDLDEVIVGGMPYNSAKEGAAADLSCLWSDEYAMLFVGANEGDPIDIPCIGRTFHYAEDGSVIGGMVESYDEPQARGRVIRVRHDVVEKVILPECGHLLSNITT